MSDEFYFCANIKQKGFPEIGFHSYKMSLAEEIVFPSTGGTFSLRGQRKTVNIIDHNA